MQGESDRIAQLRNIVRDIADTDVPVLVVGEGSLADLNARLAAKGDAALPMNRFRRR